MARVEGRREKILVYLDLSVEFKRRRMMTWRDVARYVTGWPRTISR